MITLEKIGDALKFTFSGNPLYLQDGSIELPLNSLLLVTDTSNAATFKRIDGDIFITAGYDELGMSKAELETWFKNNAVGGGGSGSGGTTPEEVQQMIDESISGLAESSAVTLEISEATSGKADADSLATVATSGSYDDLLDKPTIPTVPTDVSAFNNDAGYITSDALSGYATEQWVGEQGYITGVDLSNYATLQDIPDVTDYFDGAEYDSGTTRINFYHGNTIKAYIDASAFIIDGMIEDVRIENGYLIIDFNTASGKEDIEIPLTDIFNPSNYYDKTEVDEIVSGLNEDISAKLDATAYTPTDLSEYWTSAQTTSAIDAATSGKADTTAVTEAISAATDDMATKTWVGEQGYLTGVDLSNYATNDYVDGAVSGKADTSAVTAVNNVLTAHTADTTIHVTSADKTAWNAKSDFSGSYNDLTDKPTIPTVPTSNTAFTNDAGYITSDALSGYAESSAVTEEISAAVSGKVDTSYVQASRLKSMSGGSLSLSDHPSYIKNIDVKGNSLKATWSYQDNGDYWTIYDKDVLRFGDGLLYKYGVLSADERIIDSYSTENSYCYELSAVTTESYVNLALGDFIGVKFDGVQNFFMADFTLYGNSAQTNERISISYQRNDGFMEGDLNIVVFDANGELVYNKTSTVYSQATNNIIIPFEFEGLGFITPSWLYVDSMVKDSITSICGVDRINYTSVKEFVKELDSEIDTKVETSAITSSVTSASTDSEIPTAKAVYDAIPTGSTGGLDSDTEQLLSTAINDLNDRKIDASEVKQNYQKKGDYATKSEVALKANASDVMTLEKAKENELVTASALNSINERLIALENAVQALQELHN